MEKGGLDDKMVIIVFSFGSKGTKGNRYLAQAGLRKEKHLLAVITQDDIPDEAELPHNQMDNFCPFFYVEEFMRESGWHSTLWVANAAKLFCLYKEVPLRAIVVAAPMHLRRAMRDARKVGFNVVCGKSPLLPGEASWYEEKSLLPWTRSWFRWWIREVPLRLLPWCIYKRLTLKLN